MRSLLDVNVLLALLDGDHLDHQRCWAWADRELVNGWASCVLTQNGFVRIISQPRYPRPVTPRAAIDLLAEATADDSHQFWTCSISLLDPAVVDPLLVQRSRQVSDVYLFALAVAEGGRLVTLDRAISTDAVAAAREGQLVIL